MNAVPQVVTLAAVVNPLDPKAVLQTFGTLGVFAVLFAETGLLIGFFLPGDSLLFTAGLLASTSTASAVHLSLPGVLLAAWLGAIAGAEVGYLIGRRTGPQLLERSDRPRLRSAADRAATALERYGPAKAIVLARFVPLVRTVLNPLAGALRVDPRTFAVWQVIGGSLWSIGVTLAGFALGSRIPGIDRYLLPIVGLVVVVSLLPIGLELLRARSAGRSRTLQP